LGASSAAAPGAAIGSLEEKEEQAKLGPHEDPAFSSADVPVQTKSLERLLSKLAKKPKPKPPKKEEKNETEAAAEDAGGNETDAKDAQKEGEAKEGGEEEAKEGGEEEAKEGETSSGEGDAEAGEEL